MYRVLYLSDWKLFSSIPGEEMIYFCFVCAVSSNVGLGHNAMHWFRKDLRLHDNPSLCEALINCRTFRAVYILDPVSAKAANVSANRWRFLLDCLTDLDRKSVV